MKHIRVAGLLALGCLLVPALFISPLAEASSTTGSSAGDGGGTAETAVPWDFKPDMTASLSPGYVEVVEGHTVVCTLTGTDMDTYKKVSDNSLFQNYGSPSPDWNVTSGPNNSVTGTTTSSNANTGTFVWTITHPAQSLGSGESSHLYVDHYGVADATLITLVKDQPVFGLAQQVLVTKAP